MRFRLFPRRIDGFSAHPSPQLCLQNGVGVEVGRHYRDKTTAASARGTDRGRVETWRSLQGGFQSRIGRGLNHRIYIRLAALRAPVQPFRSPLASSRLARAMVAANCDFKRSSSCLTDASVG